MFESRAVGHEFLDEADCDRQVVDSSHRFMRFVNMCFGGTSAVKSLLAQAAGRTTPKDMLNLLDIGSGTCDIPIRVMRWAVKKNISLRFTCIERSDYACILARQAITASGLQNISVVHRDIFEYEPTETFDCVTGSMFFHHLTDEQIVTLINRLRPFVRMAVLINDLHRSVLNYCSCCLLLPLMDRITIHDALMSIKKGFTRNDLVRISGQIEHAEVVVRRRPWGRITGCVRFA